MSMKRRKAGLVISWHKSMSILAPWRKGKEDKDAILDTEVVLTKMKFFTHLHEKAQMPKDLTSSVSTISITQPNLTQAPRTNSHLDKSGQQLTETSSGYLPADFSASQLQRLYKFESEDSGVDLPSGANSPSTPTGSEQSFVVHSRESSCDSSCNLNSDSNLLPNNQVSHGTNSEIKQEVDGTNNSLGMMLDSQDSVFTELCCSAVTTEPHIDTVDRDQSRAPGDIPPGDDKSDQLEAVIERISSGDIRLGNPPSTETCDNIMSYESETEPLRRSATSESLEQYMDECCRLSETQDVSSSILGSGFGYLEHICQLIEKIGQLQETNLRLQRQICGLQKDSTMAKTREDFFNQHCSCGASSLAFQCVQKRQSRGEGMSRSGTLSDLSTIPELAQHPLVPTRRDKRSEVLNPVALWRRSLNRRSYTEGEAHFLRDSTEGLFIPQRRLTENYTWGRVKDMVKKTKLRNQSRLGLSSASLKMSCPQLYTPDLGSVEPARGNRNSMIVLGHQSRMDCPWFQ